MASSWRPPPTDHNHHDRRETKQDPESCRQDYLSWREQERCSRSSLYLSSKPSILFGQKNFARSSWICLFRLSPRRNGQWLLCIERRSRLSSSFQFSLRVWPQIAMAAFIELSKSTVTALEKGIINADHVANYRNCCGLHCRPQQFRCLCFNFSLPVGLHSILNFHRISNLFFLGSRNSEEPEVRSQLMKDRMKKWIERLFGRNIDLLVTFAKRRTRPFNASLLDTKTMSRATSQVHVCKNCCYSFATKLAAVV